MLKDGKLLLAVAEERELYLLPKMANRHGLIAGATGTGKTVTMKVMAESFSDMGVPVFLADVKGDLSGVCQPGSDSGSVHDRLEKLALGDDFVFRGFPTRFWDIFGEAGYPVRVTVSEMGPILLARLLGLTSVQTGVLNIVFRVADDHGLLLLDLKDLRAMLQFVGENRSEFTSLYGNVSSARTDPPPRRACAAASSPLRGRPGSRGRLTGGRPSFSARYRPTSYLLRRAGSRYP